MINGSPRANGNTALAFSEMEKIFHKNGIETEIVRVGSKDIRGCTSCRYCTGGCPADIPVPEYFTAYNKKLAGDSDYKEYFANSTDKKGRADMCIRCKKCEQSCPQHIEIVKKLADIKDII